jgi:UPF0716 family protein affecting phage T7 exclusion
LLIISGTPEGYFWEMGNPKMWSRMVLFVAGMLAAVPSLKSDLIGAILFPVIFGAGFLLRVRENFLATPVPEIEGE